METIPYRKSKILVKTIPKDTLLFRLTKDPENDTRGVLLDNGTRCITPNFNVYFHPTPFSGHYMYKQYAKEIGNTVHVYKLKKSIKVILLIEPSEYTRMDRIKKGIFLKPCSTVRKGCMPRKGREYDTCLSDTIIKKFPNIVGTLSISVGDNKHLRDSIRKGIPHKTLKTIRRVKDASEHSGVPELALYPLIERESKNVIVKEDDELKNNYELIDSIDYNEEKLHKFMNRHAKYDSDTNFYTYIE
jgi:hypothetical protein